MNFNASFIFDFFLPRICPGCNSKLSVEEDSVCSDCLSSILVADEERLKTEFDKNFGPTKVIKDFYSRFVFETDKTLQQIIHTLKYNQRFKLGIYLGKIIAEGLKPKNWQIDVIVPVPKKTDRCAYRRDRSRTSIQSHYHKGSVPEVLGECPGHRRRSRVASLHR